MKKDKGKSQELLDKRIAELKITRGEITEKALKSYLKSLTDVSDNAEEIVLAWERKKEAK